MNDRPIYLDTADEPVFGFLHEPALSVGAGTAVLLVPPFGWDEVASYRGRRAWAQTVADAGHLALRIDLPGTGDSGGAPDDPDRLEAWTRAVTAAATWLRQSAGARRVTVAGVGLGGLVAVRAVAAGAPIRDLVLWSVPARGRALVRELEAFSRMGDTMLAEVRAMHPVEEGAVDAGGFVLTPETAGALAAVDLTTLTLSGDPGRRALLLDRDGVRPDKKLRRHLDEAGYRVTDAPGPGYGAMLTVPHQSRPAWEVFALVNAWLEASASGTAGPAAATPASIELCTGTTRLRETALPIETAKGRMFGVLTEPLEGEAELTAVLLNAGAIRRSGPNRMWVEAARRWAAAGVATLRLDVEGIGDAEGEPPPDADVTLYVPEYVEQVRSALDALQQRGLPPRFVVGGLCSGAYWAFHVALDDPRVVAALMLNPRLLVWDAELVEARRRRDALDRAHSATWRKALRGGFGVRGSVRRAVTLLLALRHARRRARIDSSEIEDVLTRAERSAARFLLAFSEREPLQDELEESGDLERLRQLPNVTVETLPGPDHTLRPLAAQRAAHDALDRALAAELARCRTGAVA